MDPVTHAVAEARSLALHREVARLLRERPQLLDKARARVRRWQESGGVNAAWAEAWSEVLSRPLDEVVAVLGDPGRRACDLRQASPFAGALDPRARWVILRRLREEAGTP